MNSTEQAKKGLKTFFITLAISLIVFGALYFVISGTTTKLVDIEDTQAKKSTFIAVASEGGSVFGELSKQKPDVQSKAVLAGSDVSETTQSTVPDTGVTSITWSLIISLLMLVFGIYILYLNPRRLALSRFENRVKKGL